MDLLKLANVYLSLASTRSKTFNYKALELLSNKDLLTYCEETLERIGEGSSRAAFILSSKYVLKVAKNEKGLYQNSTEEAIGTDNRYRNIVPIVHKSAPDYSWIISDLVRPFSNTSISAVNYNEDIKDIKDIQKETGLTPYEIWIRSSERELREPYEDIEQDSELIKDLSLLIEEYNLYGPDVTTPSHWGKRADGKIVLLDYGLSQDLYNSMYR
jgi:hypothetical protein